MVGLGPAGVAAQPPPALNYFAELWAPSKLPSMSVLRALLASPAGRKACSLGDASGSTPLHLLLKPRATPHSANSAHRFAAAASLLLAALPAAAGMPGSRGRLPVELAASSGLGRHLIRELVAAYPDATVSHAALQRCLDAFAQSQPPHRVFAEGFAELLLLARPHTAFAAAITTPRLLSTHESDAAAPPAWAAPARALAEALRRCARDRRTHVAAAVLARRARAAAATDASAPVGEV
jgi:hypothetical protein